MHCTAVILLQVKATNVMNKAFSTYIWIPSLLQNTHGCADKLNTTLCNAIMPEMSMPCINFQMKWSIAFGLVTVYYNPPTHLPTHSHTHRYVDLRLFSILGWKNGKKRRLGGCDYFCTTSSIYLVNLLKQKSFFRMI